MVHKLPESVVTSLRAKHLAAQQALAIFNDQVNTVCTMLGVELGPNVNLNLETGELIVDED